MNLMISDVALDLGVFALDGEVGNRAASDIFWNISVAGDPIKSPFLAIAS